MQNAKLKKLCADSFCNMMRGQVLRPGCVKWVVLAISISLGDVLPGVALPLSAGDRLRIQTPSDDQLPAESTFRLSGLYEVNLDGTLQIPFLDPQPAAGLEAAQVEKRLAELLVQRGFFRAESLQLSVRVAQWAPVQVTVAGETFFPGRVLINVLPDSSDNPFPRPRAAPLTQAGENPSERYLSAALRQAGGLKPSADIRNIRLIRGKQERVLDLSGIVTGQPVPDVPLVAGDQVIVPKLANLETALVRPSQVTPRTIQVLISNLTQPAARGGQIVPMEYGTRFSQAVVVAGCVGGAKATNAKRRSTLVQTDRTTGVTRVLDRSVESLMRQSTNDADNPFLMPQDSVVCYDSRVTNATGVVRLLSDVLSPFFLIQRIFTNE
jgi:polysaccharide biosynthesis/export protein